MADVCGALCEMVEVVDDFFRFLGPELKAVTGGAAHRGRAGARRRPETRPRPRRCAGHTRSPRTSAAACPAAAPSTAHPRPCPPAPLGDAKGIDDVIERVQLMAEPVETALFNVFDSAHAGQWRALWARFYQDNDEVKASTVRWGRGGSRGAKGLLPCLGAGLGAATLCVSRTPRCCRPSPLLCASPQPQPR